MRALLATDLDRTLIYSRAALDLPAGSPTPLVAVERLDGRSLSFMTRRAAEGFAALAARHLVVPVTTRTRAQVARVVLPGPRPRYVVAANGGVLLADGVADRDWAAQVRASLAEVAPAAEAFARLSTACPQALARPVRVADGLFCYAVVDRAVLPAGAVTGLREWAGPAGWSVSLQARKLYLVPAPLTKSAAVAEVARRTGAGRVLAAGDSLLDVDLLAAADRAVRPGHGELVESGWSAPHVDALASTGVRAGEDVVGWLAARAAEGVAARGAAVIGIDLPIDHERRSERRSRGAP